MGAAPNAPLRLADHLRPDDLVVVEQGVGAPAALVGLLV
jgi:hypothetical protein